MKHIDSRVLWLQDLIAAGGVRLKKIPREQNLADMLTHTPSAKELEVFMPLIGLRCCSDREKNLMVDEAIQTRGDQGGDDEQYSVGAERKRSLKGLKRVVRM